VIDGRSGRPQNTHDGLESGANQSTGSMVSEQAELGLLTAEHLDQMLRLDQICFGGHWSIDTYQRELASDNGHFVGAFLDSHLIGMGCFWAILDEAHITLLALHPDYRGRGWGKDLLTGLLAKAVAIGMNYATLEVRASNEAAVGLYEKIGFVIAGVRKKYYQEPTEDALVMWCSGLQQPDSLDKYRLEI
jgi:[ribosomal protein S18]-alanine N-acetyltransferase